MVEQTERFPLGRLISDHWWSFFDGYMKFQYVVWTTPEDVWKYKEVDEDGNILSIPTADDIVYTFF